MPVLKAKFSEISSSYGQPLPVDTPITVTIEKVTAAKKNNKDQLDFEMKVVEPKDQEGRTIHDFVLLQKDDGTDSKIGYGRVKAYTESCLGDEAASGEEIDTDALIGQACVILLKNDTYTKDGQQKSSQKVDKVLPQG